MDYCFFTSAERRIHSLELRKCIGRPNATTLDERLRRCLPNGEAAKSLLCHLAPRASWLVEESKEPATRTGWESGAPKGATSKEAERRFLRCTFRRFGSGCARRVRFRQTRPPLKKRTELDTLDGRYRNFAVEPGPGTRSISCRSDFSCRDFRRRRCWTACSQIGKDCGSRRSTVGTMPTLR